MTTFVCSTWRAYVLWPLSLLASPTPSRPKALGNSAESGVMGSGSFEIFVSSSGIALCENWSCLGTTIFDDNGVGLSLSENPSWEIFSPFSRGMQSPPISRMASEISTLMVSFGSPETKEPVGASFVASLLVSIIKPCFVTAFGSTTKVSLLSVLVSTTFSSNRALFSMARLLIVTKNKLSNIHMVIVSERNLFRNIL